MTGLRENMMTFSRLCAPLMTALCLSWVAACDSGEEVEEDASVETLCPPEHGLTCDPVEQACCDAFEYCIAYQSAGQYRDSCRPNQGDVPEGESCLVLELAGERACRAGLICLFIPGVDRQAVCHRLCREDSDCLDEICAYDLDGLGDVKACM